MRKIFIAVLLFLVSSAYAQSGDNTNPPTDQKALIERLLARIDGLEKRVQELETKGAPGTPEAAATPATDAAVTTAATSPDAATAAAAEMHDHDSGGSFDQPFPRLLIRGFADVQFYAQNQNNAAGSTTGFQTGQFILHFSSPLSQKIRYFGELSVSQIPTGIFLNLERSIIRYDYNDNLKVSFGQFHAPTSYYNTAYHHGGWLQTTIARPAAVDFFTGPLPEHVLGAAVEGNIPSGPAGLGYFFGVGNGALGFGGGDVNNNRAVYGEFYTRPRFASGLQVGTSFWTDLKARNGTFYRELINAGHIVLKNETPELIIEFSNTRHTDVNTGRTWNSQMGFVQVAYRLPWDNKKWKPYYLFDYINTPATEPVFGVRDLVGSTAGIRYDISDFAAFKLEYRNQKRTSLDPRFEGIFLQTAFTF